MQVAQYGKRDAIPFKKTPTTPPGMKKSPSSQDHGLLVELPSGSLPLTEMGETLRRGGRVNSVQRDPIREALAVSLSLRRLPPKGRATDLDEVA
jgi:hypothetical protein